MRFRRDIHDEESIFTYEEQAARRAERAHKFAEGLEQERVEEERRAAARARVIELSLKINRRQVLAEYTAAGVEPLPGSSASLSLLRSLGWTVQEIEGKPTLVKPPMFHVEQNAEG